LPFGFVLRRLVKSMAISLGTVVCGPCCDVCGWMGWGAVSGFVASFVACLRVWDGGGGVVSVAWWQWQASVRA
jgi:hypothetical protein